MLVLNIKMFNGLIGLFYILSITSLYHNSYILQYCPYLLP